MKGGARIGQRKGCHVRVLSQIGHNEARSGTAEKRQHQFQCFHALRPTERIISSAYVVGAEIPMTTHWLRPSMGCTRRKLSTSAVPGGLSTKWNTQPWSGLTGSIIAGCWSPSAISHRRSWKWRIIANWKSRPWWPDSNKRVSGIPGAIQPGARVGTRASGPTALSR